MKKTLIGLFATALLVCTLPGIAAAATPTRFEQYGTVDDIDIQAGKIVVGDALFLITAATPVVLSTGQRVPVNTLQKGMKVGCSVGPTVKGRVTSVTQVWILPKDYVPPQED